MNCSIPATKHKGVLRLKLVSNLCSFKSDFKKVFSKEKVSNLFNYSKSLIIEYVSSELSSQSKKFAVDTYVKSYITKTFKSNNKLIHFLINMLLNVVPVFTQAIYDTLKQHVDGLTEV